MRATVCSEDSARQHAEPKLQKEGLQSKDCNLIIGQLGGKKKNPTLIKFSAEKGTRGSEGEAEQSKTEAAEECLRSFQFSGNWP